MGDLYLCSRTDILRNLYLDTGRNVAIIGAPEDFISWIDKILPISSEKVEEPPSLERDEFDVILYWIEKGYPARDSVIPIMDRLTEDGDLWLSVALDKADSLHQTLGMEKPLFHDQLRLMLRPDRMMVPVHIGSDRS